MGGRGSKQQARVNVRYMIECHQNCAIECHMQSVKENGQTEMEAGAFWEKQGFLRQ